MPERLPLRGIRVHLSGAMPDRATDMERGGIATFVERFAAAVLREGGSLVHGSHPHFTAPLSAAALPFIASGGAKDALIFVRAEHYASSEYLSTIEEQRRYATVQLIPSSPEEPDRSLLPMREWMADRCDVIVAVGGRHYDVNKARAGVPKELEEALGRGRPGFLVAGFGGAAAGYLGDDETLLSRLRNGLSKDENLVLAESTDVDWIVRRIVTQIQRLPLTRAGVQSGRLFRILALDGGGIRGAFTAAVLAKWDDMLRSGGGNGIVQHFDLVSGTSTGALLAIGLALGKTPLEMLDFYREEGGKIFPQGGRLRHWLKSKHDAIPLRATLEKIFKDRQLTRDSCCRLVIPTVRAIHGEAEAIVTKHSPDRGAFTKMTAVDAALASSAAPTYFDAAEYEDSTSRTPYLDGGIWANNPVLPAIAEAVRYLDVPLDRIDVLSVGTLGSEMDFSASLNRGKAGWAPEMADLFFAAQERGAAILADSFLGRARHLRVNQQTPRPIDLDDVRAIDELERRGAAVGQDTFAAVRSRFLDGFHAPDWRKTAPPP